MPTSIDPGPAENEFECANCGAYFHYELTRCPNCGIQIYEPEGNDAGGIGRSGPQGPGMFDWLKDALHGIFNKPYAADEIFGDALDASILYDDLLQKTAGDRAAADRLIEFEKVRAPQFTRRKWIKSAIQNWERDNQSPPPPS
ncbi:MAG: hypothetical protein K8S20_08365 [Chloroflexi bacterium]|nr:hypothetical protein [Chloroflexota bacterium]